MQPVTILKLADQVPERLGGQSTHPRLTNIFGRVTVAGGLRRRYTLYARKVIFERIEIGITD